jgi:outer membrane protein OmpA-like peptidoglycan-associated protein
MEVLDEMPQKDLEVYFDYNSSAVTSQAVPVLKQLGEALKNNELSADNFVVAGHTDGTGDPDYNRELSERRATAVRSYLVQELGVPESHLTAIGYGQERLKAPDQPAAAENRRVQVVNMGN